MAGRRYLDFELAIEEIGDERFRTRVLSSPAGEARGTFTFPLSQLEVENFLLRVSRGAGARRRRLESSEREAARTFGAKLFDAVFAEDVELCLRRSIDEAERSGQGLRIRLRLSDAPSLSGIPWEFLYSSSNDRFLVLSSWTPLVRYLDLPRRIRPLHVDPPVRILVMISSPTDYPALDTEAEWARLNEGLSDLVEAGRVELHRLDGASLTALQRALLLRQYHALHFIGHGGFDEPTGDGVLMLEGSGGRARIVPGRDLGTILHDHRSMRLAILNACEGGRTSVADPFSGTAQSLVRAGLPAVVAMQFEISDVAAVAFAHAFYAAIALGLPVDASVTEARKAVFSEGHDAEWGTPVVYMRSPDGQIFDIPPAEDPPAAALQPAADTPVPTVIPVPQVSWAPEFSEPAPSPVPATPPVQPAPLDLVEDASEVEDLPDVKDERPDDLANEANTAVAERPLADAPAAESEGVLPPYIGDEPSTSTPRTEASSLGSETHPAISDAASEYVVQEDAAQGGIEDDMAGGEPAAPEEPTESPAPKDDVQAQALPGELLDEAPHADVPSEPASRATGADGMVIGALRPRTSLQPASKPPIRVDPPRPAPPAYHPTFPEEDPVEEDGAYLGDDDLELFPPPRVEARGWLRRPSKRVAAVGAIVFAAGFGALLLVDTGENGVVEPTPVPTEQVFTGEPASEPNPDDGWVVAEPLSGFVADGDLDEWQDFEFHVTTPYKVFESPRANWDGNDDVESKWWLGYDDDFLYVAVSVTDDIHNQPSTGNQIYRGDAVDIHIGPVVGDTSRPNEHHFQVILSPGDFANNPPAHMIFQGNGVHFAHESVSPDLELFARQTDYGYIIEAAIPWQDVGLDRPPTEDDSVRLLLSVFDNDGEFESDTGKVAQTIVKSHVDAGFQQPETWGSFAVAE